MASGIAHYLEAEKILARGDEDATALARAQIHATLALAAATALKGPGRARWGKVAGRQEEVK